jgi:8-oxo-dGTP pyrophosphatase MutT (NUDIX family)
MSIDPSQFPLDRAFDDRRVRGEPLAPEQLTPAALRRRFLQRAAWAPELSSDVALEPQPAEAPKPAAVLVPLIRRGELTVLLTRRSRHLQAHAGQISFPGGRVEASDRGPVEAALREAGEETGLATGRIEVLGTLPLYLTITRFEVTPVVALVEPPIELELDAGEVEDAFEVPLSFLMDPRNHQRRVVMVAAGQRFVYTMPYHDGSREWMIWGVTAAIIRNLYGFLRAGESR